jgi:outer membrane biosynthesis protein TonB
MSNVQRGIYQPMTTDKAPLYNLADEDPEDDERSRAPLLVVIALVVLAAFAGVVWIAYNQGLERGRQGASLVITAPAGPVRVAPEPAAESPLSGLQVYKDPVPPEQEAQKSALAKQAPPPAAAAPQIRLGQPPSPAPAPARPAAPATAVAPPPAAAPARPPQPAASAPQQTAQAARPAQPAPASPAQSAAPAATAQPAGKAASGGAVLQIGAFDSEELANGAWQAFRSRYSAAAALSPDIQRADLGAKGIMYRLRIGPFADRSAAADACVQLRAQGANCFVAAP